MLGHLGDEAEPGTRDDALAVVGYFNPRKCSGSLHLQGALLVGWLCVWITTVSLARRAFSRIQMLQKSRLTERPRLGVPLLPPSHDSGINLQGSGRVLEVDVVVKELSEPPSLRYRRSNLDSRGAELGAQPVVDDAPPLSHGLGREDPAVVLDLGEPQHFPGRLDGGTSVEGSIVQHASQGVRVPVHWAISPRGL